MHTSLTSPANFRQRCNFPRCCSSPLRDRGLKNPGVPGSRSASPKRHWSRWRIPDTRSRLQVHCPRQFLHRQRCSQRHWCSSHHREHPRCWRQEMGSQWACPSCRLSPSLLSARTRPRFRRRCSRWHRYNSHWRERPGACRRSGRPRSSRSRWLAPGRQCAPRRTGRQ